MVPSAFTGGLCVPNNLGIKMQILDEAYHEKYTIHPATQKCIITLRVIGGTK